jgi:hypothetical protein
LLNFVATLVFSGGNKLRVEFSQFSSRKNYFVATSSALALNANVKTRVEDGSLMQIHRNTRKNKIKKLSVIFLPLYGKFADHFPFSL